LSGIENLTDLTTIAATSSSIAEIALKQGVKKIGSLISDQLSQPPLNFSVSHGQTGIVIVNQSQTNADIKIEQSEGVDGAVALVTLFNLSKPKIEIFRNMSLSRVPIIISLGYQGKKLKRIGKFLILTVDQGYEIKLEGKGGFDSRYTFHALEYGAWLAKYIKLSYSSQEERPDIHFKNVISKANSVVPQINVGQKITNPSGAKSVNYESRFTTLFNILNDIARRFRLHMQSIGDIIYASPQLEGIAKSPAKINGNYNTLYFRPIVEYTADNTDEDDVVVSVTSKNITGYKFSVAGDPDVRVWHTIECSNVDFGKGIREPRKVSNLVITHVIHRYNSKGGYTCSGILTMPIKEAPEKPFQVTRRAEGPRSVGRALTNLIESSISTKQTVDVGEVSNVVDDEHATEYTVSVVTGMNAQVKGKDTDRYSRNLPLPQLESESNRFSLKNKVTVSSPYMGPGYGMFFPATIENVRQRALLLNHHDESDPIIVGYITTNQMASAEDFPKHNAGDLYLFTRAGSKILIPTRVDDTTVENEVGSITSQFKSVKIEVGNGVIAERARPTPGEPESYLITQNYGSNKNHIHMKEDGKIYIVHKATSLIDGDVVLTIEDGKLTIDATDFQLNGDLNFDGDLVVSGDIQAVNVKATTKVITPTVGSS